MTDIVRFTWEWSGFTGAPGFTNIYAQGTDPEDVGIAFHAFLAGTAAALPDDVHIHLRNEGEVISAETGVLQAVIPFTPPADVVGANTGPYSAASGMCISWSTGGLVAGHRVRGRTFIVPLSGAAYDTTGTLQDDTVTGERSLLTTYLGAAAGQMVIWSRPRTGLAGSAHPVTGFTLRDRVAVLRSRRD